MHPIFTPKGSSRAFSLLFIFLSLIISASGAIYALGTKTVPVAHGNLNNGGFNFLGTYLRQHPNAPLNPNRMATGQLAAGPLWSFASGQSQVTTGGCLLCTINNPQLAIDGDTTTASTLVLAAGVVGSIGQKLQFSGSYLAGDQVAIDLEIPNQIYTKQLLSAVQIQTFNAGVANNDPVTLDNALVRVQVLGIGLGTTNKFRVVVPIAKDFDAVQVSLSALFAEFGSLRIYEAAAIIPVTVPTPPVIPVGGSTTLNASMPRIPGATFKWYSTPAGGTPLSTSSSFTTPALSRSTTYYVEASTGTPGLQSYVRTPVHVTVSGGNGALWSFASDQQSPITSGLACALCFVDYPELAVDTDTSTASRIVLPAGIATSAGQRLIFSGSYKAGDNIALDLEIPNKFYTKQALSGIQIETFNNGVSNGDATNIGTALLRLQALGIGPGGISKFRVIFPVTKDFNAVQVSLSALFAEFGALKIYDAAAFIPVKVSQDTVSITSGQTANLTASIDPRMAGATFAWYADSVGGTPLATGPSFTTPALTTSTNYYVEATTPDGLHSFVRTPVNVSVSGGAGAIWSFANSQTSPITGGIACALCFVDSAALAVDGDTTTASKLVLPVGAVTSIGQLLKFPGSYKAGDNIALDLQIPNAIYTKQLLSAVKVHTFNGGVDNADPVTLNSALIRLQALGIGIGGTPKFRVIIPVQKDFDAVQVDLSALFAEFGSLRIYEASAFIPVTVTPDSAMVVRGGTTTLNAAIARVPGATFQWFSTPSGGTPLGNGASFTTPALTNTTTYYVQATSPTGKSSYVRTPVTVNVVNGAGAIWSYADQEQSPITSGVACALCFVDSAALAVDGDTTTASKLVLPVGALTSVGQLLKFPGNYKAGNSIALDLQIPNTIYTKQLLSAVKVHTFNGGVDNADPVTLNSALIRLQALGIGIGGTPKFRVIIPVQKDFDAVQVDLSALFAEFGSLRIYDATAFIPVKVSPDTANVVRGGSVTFAASINQIPGATIQWFSTPTGGTPLSSGPSFTTPALSRSITYYAEATSPDGKKSYVRTAVPVTVSGGVGPLWSYADQEQSPITSGVACALCFVDSANLAIDGDTTTASKLVLPVGALTSVGQLLKFPGSYKAGDNIALDLQIPNTIYTKQLLSAVKVHTFNGSVDNADPVTLNSSLIRLQLLGIGIGGTPKFRVIIPVQKDFDAVQVDLSALFAEFGSLRIYEATAFIPVTVTPPAPTTTAGGTVALTAGIDQTRISNPSFNWYTTPTGGTPVFTGTNFTTPPLARNQTYYLSATSPVDGLNSYVRTPVSIKVAGGPGTIWSFGQDQVSPITSGIACAACVVTNPQLAADGDTTTASTFTTGIGVGTTLSQQVIMPGVYQPGDSIVLFMDLPADPILNAQLLPNISVQTFNNAIAGPAVPNNDQVFLNNTGLVRLQALGLGLNGTNKFRVTIPATKTFDAVQVGQGSLAALSSSLHLYEVAAAIPVTVTPSPATVNYNKPATLNAAIRVPNATFQWFTTPTGGAPIPGGGATFTTPNLTRNTTYFVEATDPAGTKSFTRTAVTVKVSGGNGPLWSYGTDQVSPITGGIACALCTVQDSLKAIDGDTTTASKLIAPIGLLGSVSQKIIFPGAYQAGDSIILFLGSPVDLLAQASVLKSISVQTSKAGVENGDITPLNQNVIGLNVLGLGTDGSHKYRVAIPATKPFDAAQVNLGGLATVSNSLNVYEVAASIPVTVAVTPTDTTVNVGQTATFNASIPRIPDATFTWYETPTGGTALATTNSFTTPPLTQGKTYYVEATSPSDGLVSFQRTAVTVRVNNAPTNASLACGAAKTQTWGPTGICLLCSVDSAANAVDNSIYTASAIHTVIGVLGGEQQTLSFGKTGKGTDSIRIKIGIPASLIDAGILSNISITTYNAGVAKVTTPLSGGLLTLTLLGTEQVGTLTIPAGQPFDAVQVGVTGLASVATTVKIYYASIVTPNAAVTNSNVNVCTGATATLTTSGPAGYSFRWYNQAVGGTPIGFGPSFTTPALTADANYYVEAITQDADSCASSVRTLVSVRIGQPTVAVTPASAQVAQGATPTFNVVSPVATNKYNWYTTPTGGTPVFVGPTFSVPPVTGNITYYVESTDATGTCKSLRTPVAITLTGGGGPSSPGDIDCGGATSQLSYASGLCVGCYVEKQDSSVDNSTATASVLHTILGVLGAYTQQTLIFPTPGNAGDSVRVGLSVNTGLLDASVLGSIVIGSYNGSTSNNDSIALNSALIKLNLLSGSQRATIAFKPAGNFDRIFVRLNSGVATALTSLNLHYAQIFTGTPTVEKDTVYVCSGQTATLKATGPGSSFRWYNQITGGTPLATTATYTVPNVTANAVYYVESVSGPGCTSPARKAVNIIVGLPTVIVAPQTVSVNSGSTATFTITNPNPAYQYNWYDAPAGGTQVAANKTSFTTPPLTAAKIYYVEAFDPVASCASSQRTKVIANINMSPEPTPCSYANQQQSPIISGVCVLCGVSNPGLAVDTNANSASTISATLGALGYVGQLLQFQNTYAAGDSVSVDMEIPGQLVTAALLGGIRLQTYNGATPNNDMITLNSGLVHLSLLSTGNRFRVTIPTTNAFNGVLVSINGTVSLLTDLNVYFAAAFPPRPTLSQTSFSTCAGKPDTLTVTAPANADIKWFDAAIGGNQVGSGYTFITPALTTTTTYYAESGKFGCANPVRVPAIVNVGAGPAAPTAPGVSLCAGGKATLVASAPAGVQFHWYRSATDTAVLATGTSFVTPVLTADTAYYVASDNNGCISTRTRVPVTLGAVPGAFTVTPQNTTVSRGQGAIINATATGAGVVFKWYTATGDSIFVGPSFNTGPLQSTSTYLVEAVGPNGCATARQTVTVTVLNSNGNDVPCDAANDQTNTVNGICVGCYVDNPALAVDSSVSTSSTLHVIAGLLGGYVQQTLIFPSPSIAGDSVNILLNFPVGLTDISLLSSLQVATYNGATFNNDRLSVGSTLLTLRLLSGNQQAMLTFKPTATFDRVEVRLNSGAATLLTAVGINYASRLVATPQVASDSVTVCSGDSARMAVKNPVSGVTYRWYNQANGGTVLGTGTSFTSTPVSAATTFYVEASKTLNGCANPVRTAVKVNMTTPPATPGQPSSVTICAGATAVLAVPTPDTTLRYNWYNVATGGAKLNTDSGFTFKAANITTDTTFYVEAMNKCGAVSARQSVSIHLGSSLQTPVITPSPDTVFINQQPVLRATPPVANAVVAWFASNTATDTLFKGTTFAPAASTTAGTVTYWAQAIISGSCASARVPVNVVTISGPGPIPVPCEGATTQTVGGNGLLVLGNVYNPQLAVDNDQTTASSLVINLGALNASVWERAGFNGLSAPGDSVRVLLSSPNQILSAALLASVQLTTYNGSAPQDSVLTSNPLLFVKLLGGGRQAELTFLPAHPFDAVEVKLKSGIVGALTEVDFNYARRIMAAPQVQASNVSVCGGSTATLNVANPVTGITYRWYTSNGTYLPGKDGNSFTTGVLTKDSVFYVEAFRAATGCASSTRTAVNVSVGAIPVAPAVLADTVAVCPGADAVLAVSNPVKGYSYGWFNTPTGGTQLNTDSGFVYKVTNVTAQAIYYVQAKNDSCNTVSANRTAVLVQTASSLAAPTVTPSPARVDTGQQAILTASAATANASFTWFRSQTGADTLAKGAVFTPAIRHAAAVDTFWVEASLPGAVMCKSARTSVLVITSPVPVDVVPCEGATSQTTGGSGLLVMGNVYNPQLAVDNNTNTASSLVINLGALNANVWERAYFNGPSAIGDTVKVMLSSPSQILSAALLASVQLTTYNGNIPGDSVTPSNPLVNLKVLSGTRGVLLSFVPTKTFNAIEVKLKSGVAAALTAVDFNYAQRAIAAPTATASGDSTVCVGKSATLSVVNPQPGLTYSWYDSKGAHLKDSVAFVTPTTLAAGSYGYTVSASRNGCTSAASAPVNVTVQAVPAPPVADSSNPAVVCAGKLPVTLKVKPVAGITFNWFDANGQQIATNSATYTTQANLIAGNYTFFVVAANTNGCSNDSGRTKIMLKVDSAATAASINISDITICAGDTAILKPTSAISNPVFKWYADANKVTPITTGVNTATGVLSIPGLATGTYTYYVSVSDSGTCENAAGALKKVTVNVGNRATAADITVTGATTTCPQTTVTLTASSTTVTNPVFNWYSDSKLTHLLHTGATYTTDTLNAATTYYVSVTGSNKCANMADSGKAVTINVNAITVPVVAPVAICSGQTATLSVSNADASVTYTWYNNMLRSSILQTGSTFTTGAITSDTAFYLEAKKGACVLQLVKVMVTVNGAPLPVVDTVQAICAGQRATLSIKTPVAGITYKWFNVATGGTPLNTDAGTTFITDTLRTTTIFYVAAVGNAACVGTSARVPVTVTISPLPAAPQLVSATQTVCAGNGVIFQVLNPDPNMTYRWTNSAGVQIGAGPIDTIPGVTTTGDYYVTAFNKNGCGGGGSSTKAHVDVSGSLVNPIVGDTSICRNQPVTLQVKNITAGASYSWYSAATGGQLLSNAATFTTGTLSSDTAFYVQASNGTCTSVSRTKVNVFVGSAPKPTVDNNNKQVCAGSSVTFTITSATNGVTYKWYNVATGGTPLNTDNGATFTSGALSASVTYYVESVAALSCGTAVSPRVAVAATVQPAPAAPQLVTNSQHVCGGGNVTFNINNPDPSLTYNWYDAAVNGTLKGTGTSFTASGVTASVTYYVAAFNSAGCSNTGGRTAAAIIVDAAPGAPVVTIPAQTTCLNNIVTFNISNPDPALTYKWYNAVGNDSVAVGTSFTTAKLTATTNYYVIAQTIGGCNSLSRTNISATVVDSISTPNVNATQTVCVGTPATLSVINPNSGLVYHWYHTATDATPFATGSQVQVTGLTANASFFVDAQVANGTCVSTGRARVDVTVSTVPPVPTVKSANVSTCTGGNATLQVQNPNPAFTYTWYTAPQGGAKVNTGDSVTVGPINANQVYYVEATNAGGCASPTRALVNVFAGVAPDAPSVTGNEPGQCPGSTYTLTATSTTPGAVFNWYTTATGGAPVATGATFITPQINADVTYYAEAAIGTGCASASRTAVNIAVLKPLATPVVDTANTTATSITFTWQPVPGATHYEVTLDNGVTFIPPSSGANGTTHTVTGLQPNQSVTIRVRALSDKACQTSALSNGITDKTRNPQGNNIFVPNLFSPNGDGVNDILYVYGTSIAQLEFRVYNQWGQLAFQSKDQHIGWDGTMGGQKQPVGVYVWQLRAVMQDGTVIIKKGNVTIMR
ncbi:Ig-like domain-containing protein [Chitinophaga vietnamensis]|uniref:Ig-like domain-containing protein n=1 Tax=Chitinophaga vietnamensis TaxID=2593957 RepID=UPI001178745F|nr:gliding motility-associated C-terminal domain-containing protein [Chitinophaga vietnamensis]